MKLQFLSIILCVTLLASAFAGAISVSIKSAKADSVSYIPGDTLYWEDFKEYVYSLSSSSQGSDLDTIFTYCERWWDPSEGYDVNIFVIMEDADNFTFLVCTWGSTYSNSVWGLSYFELLSDPYWQLRTLNTNDPSTNVYISTRGYFKVVNGNLTNVSTLRDTQTIPYRYGALNITNSNDAFYWYPCPFDGSAGLKCYCLRDLVGVPGGSTLLTSNIVPGSEIHSFELAKFQLGERTYLTTKDQNYIFAMQPQDDDYLYWGVGFMQEDGSDYDIKVLEYSDLTLIPGAESWLNVGLQNIHSQGVLAFDITDLLTWHDISYSSLYWIIENPGTEDPSQYRLFAEASNTPFVLAPAAPDEPSYTQAWDQYYTYVNNYNTNHVIPEQLGEWLFNAEGSKMLPCTIQVPSSVAGSPTHFINVFSYYTGMNTSGYNFDIMDVVIIDAGAATGYQLRYWYDDSLDPAYTKVDQLVLANVIASFDIVIISNDDEGWFEEALAGSLAYTGSSSQGIVHSSVPLVDSSTTGFMLITQRGIQKQQLYNFNDGITKLYQLEVDYIESEDLWKDSFLLWSASIFNMLNSLDGRLNDINSSLLSISSLIESIKTAVDHMAYDDDPENLQPWYLSLWNWISNFRPSDSDFSATLNQYDNNWEDFPELPAPSTVPLLPGGE